MEGVATLERTLVAQGNEEYYSYTSTSSSTESNYIKYRTRFGRKEIGYIRFQIRSGPTLGCGVASGMFVLNKRQRLTTHPHGMNLRIIRYVEVEPGVSKWFFMTLIECTVTSKTPYRGNASDALAKTSMFFEAKDATGWREASSQSNAYRGYSDYSVVNHRYASMQTVDRIDY